MTNTQCGLVRALKDYRRESRVSRESVAREMGTSVATLYRWEKGLSAPTGLSKSALEKFLKKNKAN